MMNHKSTFSWILGLLHTAFLGITICFTILAIYAWLIAGDGVWGDRCVSLSVVSMFAAITTGTAS